MVKKRRGQSAAFMRSINPNLRHSRKSSTIKRGYSTMVKHRRKSYGRKTRRSSSKNGKMNVLKTLLFAGGYGLVRNTLANFTTPMVNKVIATPYNDHLGNGAVAFAAYKFGSGAIKEMGKMGLIIEAASAASGINIGNLTGQSQTNNSGYTFN